MHNQRRRPREPRRNVRRRQSSSNGATMGHAGLYRLSNAAFIALAIALCIAPPRTRAGQGGPPDAPLLADFKAFCVDTGAQPRAMAALAHRLGLKRVASNWRPPRAPWPHTAWEHDVGADTIIIGSSTMPRGGEAPAASDVCNVLDPVDNARSVEGLARWVGVSPIDPKAV